ncbi:MAG TPA: anion permease, partial [Chryseobacterium sp.]|nr:anion permease [Chryseobacterium sp.]
SSSSHTLIGGFLGAALMHALVMDYHHVALANPDLGIFEKLKLAFQQLFTQNVVKYEKVIPIFLFIFMAPFIGMLVSVIITLIIVNLAKNSNPRKADAHFKKWQLASSALFSLGHGLNDAQKVMGIIGAAVIYYHVTLIGGTDEYALMDSADRFKHFT